MGLFIHRRKVREHMKANPLPECTVSVSQVDASAEKMEEGVSLKSPSESKLTEEDINKLPYFSLKALASNYGIDVTDKKTKELRKELIKKIKEEEA